MVGILLAASAKLALPEARRKPRHRSAPRIISMSACLPAPRCGGNRRAAAPVVDGRLRQRPVRHLKAGRWRQVSDWPRTGEAARAATAASRTTRIESSQRLLRAVSANVPPNRAGRNRAKIRTRSPCGCLSPSASGRKFVDALQGQFVGDQGIDGNLAVHVPVHDLRHLCPAAHAAERRAFPHPVPSPAGRPCLDLLRNRRRR